MKADETRAEYVLPTLTDDMMRGDGLTVDVLTTNAEWFGMTYQEDKPYVQRQLLADAPAGLVSRHSVLAEEAAMKILLTGGTGYIGSHTYVELCAAGHTR